MKKLKLNLDELKVESMNAEELGPGRGTVQGFISLDGVCSTHFCATGEASCGQLSCVYTCTSCNPYGCGSCG
ncbi:MAG TPA: hypothetical protein VEX86_19595 [Longimicrobium sp.]|nr:hypothetical protein [Longimicrobium sp.]